MKDLLYVYLTHLTLETGDGQCIATELTHIAHRSKFVSEVLFGAQGRAAVHTCGSARASVYAC